MMVGCQAIVVGRSYLRGGIRLNLPNESKGLTYSEVAAVAASYVTFRLLLTASLKTLYLHISYIW